MDFGKSDDDGTGGAGGCLSFEGGTWYCKYPVTCREGLRVDASSFPGLSSQLLPTPHLPSLISPLAALPSSLHNEDTATQGSAMQLSLSHLAVTAFPRSHLSVLSWWLPKGVLGRSGPTSAFSTCPSGQPLQEGMCPGISGDQSLVLDEHPEVQHPVDLSGPVATCCI